MGPIMSAIIDNIKENITEWLMVIITAVYVWATFQIRKANQESAKVASEAVKESQRQFEENLKESQRQFEENLRESQRQFETNLEESKRQFEVNLNESRIQFEKNLRLQEKHNRDSVRPAVMVQFSSVSDGTGLAGKITINNHGLGPAIIKELKFKKGNNVYENSNKYCTIGYLIEKRMFEENIQHQLEGVFTHQYTKEFRDIDKDRDYLAVNEDLCLLEFATQTFEESEIVGKIFDGVEMELVYTDLYDDDTLNWTIIKKLSFFKLNWRGSKEIENPVSD